MMTAWKIIILICQPEYIERTLDTLPVSHQHWPWHESMAVQYKCAAQQGSQQLQMVMEKEQQYWILWRVDRRNALIHFKFYNPFLTHCDLGTAYDILDLGQRC